MSQSVCILGATGMLGSMVLDVLASDPDLAVTATVRTVAQGAEVGRRYPHVTWILYDAERPAEKTQFVAQHNWVVNCIGITKPLIHENVPAEVERAIRVNALWPHQLAAEVSLAGHRLLQIATDCVFSGRGGPYAEPSTPDAHDVYGRTKSLGEPRYHGVTNIRTSIIGPETGPSKFLLEWVRRQPQNAAINGYSDHYWNGVTTLQFAEVCRGIIRERPETLPSLIHLVPKDIVTKFQLLKIIAGAYGRYDIGVNPASTPHVNMILATHQPKQVHDLWRAAGYSAAPTIEYMVYKAAHHSA